MLFTTLTVVSRFRLSRIRPFSTFLKDYVFPELNEKDLEENFVHGSGPGGQNVNKAFNCVVLRHVPTGLWVKVHDSRSVIKNREIARERLRMHLDDHLNGENSYSAQKKRFEAELSERRQAERARKREMKESFKKLLEEEERKKQTENQDER